MQGRSRSSRTFRPVPTATRSVTTRYPVPYRSSCGSICSPSCPATSHALHRQLLRRHLRPKLHVNEFLLYSGSACSSVCDPSCPAASSCTASTGMAAASVLRTALQRVHNLLRQLARDIFAPSCPATRQREVPAVSEPNSLVSSTTPREGVVRKGRALQQRGVLRARCALPLKRCQY